jgi:hypothetical protein
MSERLSTNMERIALPPRALVAQQRSSCQLLAKDAPGDEPDVLLFWRNSVN